MSTSITSQRTADVASCRADLDPSSGLPTSYRSELDPTSIIGQQRLSKAGFTINPEAQSFTLLTRDQARDFLAEYDRRHPAPSAPAAPPQAAAAKTKAKAKGSRKPTALPRVYSNRKLERCLHQAGLTPKQKAIARKVLSMLRSARVTADHGVFIKRSSLGPSATVKRTFSALRQAGLITESKPVHGNSTTRLTNLGPAFLNGLKPQPLTPQNTTFASPKPTANTGKVPTELIPQDPNYDGSAHTTNTAVPEGSKLIPQNPTFASPKTLANTGEVDSKLIPHFRNPLKRVPMGPGPLASAPLRATASKPAPRNIQHKDNSSTLTLNPTDLSFVDAQPTPCHQFNPGDAISYRGKQLWFVTFRPSTSDCVLIDHVDDKPCVVRLSALRLTAVKL